MATLTELLARLRSDLDDVATPQFWTDDELVQYINESENEACDRARLILDSDSDLCSIRLLPGQSKYEIDQRVMWIKRAYVVGERHPLERVGVDNMDRDCPGWQSNTGVPRYLIPNMDACWVKVSPVPIVTAKVDMTLYRYPLKPLSLLVPNKQPEIGRRYHIDMLEWAKHLAYSKHDGDSLNTDAATLHAGKFASMFGEKRDAEQMEWLRTKRDQLIMPDYR